MQKLYQHKRAVKKKFKLNLYYAETCNELAGPIAALLRLGNIASFEEMSQRWRAFGKLTGPRFESQTSRFKDKRPNQLDQLAGQTKNRKIIFL